MKIREYVTMDFKRYAFDLCVRLEGNVIEEYDMNPDELVVLFDENHRYVNGIRQSLRNAVKLIDAGVVDFIGVEGFTGNVGNQVDPFGRRMGYPPMGYARRRFENMRVSEAKLIETAYSFAGMLVLLRPDCVIYGVEDAASYKRSGEEIERWERSFAENAARIIRQLLEERKLRPPETLQEFEALLDLPEFAEVVNSRLKSETVRFIETRVRADRPRHFVENLIQGRKETGADRVAILNAGRMDQDMVCDILKEKQISFIRIRPSGFPQSEIA